MLRQAQHDKEIFTINQKSSINPPLAPPKEGNLFFHHFCAAYSPFFAGAAANLGWISADGGEVTRIENANGRGNPHFVKAEG